MRQLNSDRPVSFSGKYNRLQDRILLPRPARPGGPPILIAATVKSAPCPWWPVTPANGTACSSPQKNTPGATVYWTTCSWHGAPAGDVRRSLMTQIVFGRDEANTAVCWSIRSESDLARAGSSRHAGQLSRSWGGWLRPAPSASCCNGWPGRSGSLEAFAQTVLPRSDGRPRAGTKSAQHPPAAGATGARGALSLDQMHEHLPASAPAPAGVGLIERRILRRKAAAGRR